MADKQDAMPTHSDQDEYRVEQEEVVDADSDDGDGSDGVRSSTSLDRFVMRSNADQQTSSACAAAAPPVEFDYSQGTILTSMHDRKSMREFAHYDNLREYPEFSSDWLTIFVVVPNFKTLVVNGVDHTKPVSEIMTKVAEKLYHVDLSDLSMMDTRLVFNDKTLDLERTVESYGIQQGAYLYLLYKMSGGGGRVRVTVDKVKEKQDRNKKGGKKTGDDEEDDEDQMADDATKVSHIRGMVKDFDDLAKSIADHPAIQGDDPLLAVLAEFKQLVLQVKDHSDVMPTVLGKLNKREMKNLQTMKLASSRNMRMITKHLLENCFAQQIDLFTEKQKLIVKMRVMCEKAIKIIYTQRYLNEAWLRLDHSRLESDLADLYEKAVEDETLLRLARDQAAGAASSSQGRFMPLVRRVLGGSES
jgi:hypothetical protein